MLTRGDRHRLERLSAGVHRTVTIGHEIGLTARGRNARIAERTGITDRSVRRHALIARTAGIHMPHALPGRRPRTDYSTSRRGYRRQRGQRRDRGPELDPWTRAARSIARPGDSETELVRILRAIGALWSEHPAMAPGEAAAALRMYLDNGGRLGPEAEQWWRYEAPRLPLDGAHTPWRAAASPRHLRPWLERRRARERAALAEQRRDARQRADEARSSAAPPDLKERLRAAESRLRGPP